MYDFAKLINNARPMGYKDEGSERQIDAECELHDALLDHYGKDLVVYWINKVEMCRMTADESLNFLADELKSGDWK